MTKKRNKQLKKNPKFAVGYIRYSSDNQREESVDAQRRAIQKWADENGITIIKWYIDRATTGTSSDRKDFKQMMNDSVSSEWSLVLVHKLDRFSRDLHDSVHYEYKLSKNGVSLFSIIEQLDDSAESTMMKSVLMGMAAYYSKNLARETLKGQKENAYNAKTNGGVLAYGYKRIPRVENGILVTNKKGMPLNDIAIDPTNAEAVKLIFNMTLAGKFRNEILIKLKELGYKKNGKDLVGTNLDHILRNERYTGKYIFHFDKKARNYDPKKNVITKEVPELKIIEQSTFDAVAQILKNRIREPNNYKENYLLGGKVFCGVCGTPFTGARQLKGGKSYTYYKCNHQTTYKNGRNVESCKNNTVQRDKLEKYVTREIFKVILSEQTADKVLEEFNRYAKELTSNSELIANYENQVLDIDKKINNIITFISNGHFSETLQLQLSSLELEKKRLTDTIADEKQVITYIPATKQELKQVYNQAKDLLLNGSFEEQKQVLNLFLNKVIIFPQKAEIFVNLIPFSHLSGIDINIDHNDLLTQNNQNTSELDENTALDSENNENLLEYKEKDGEMPSLLLSTIHSENLIGSSGGIRTYDPSVNSRMLLPLSYRGIWGYLC